MLSQAFGLMLSQAFGLIPAAVHVKSPRTPGVISGTYHVVGAGRCGVDESEPELTLEQWQALEALWKAILVLEASIDAARLGMGGLQAEMETAFRKSLSAEDKLHALQADIVQWNNAKSRVHHALPKVREFIHRATWAVATPERKRLEELVEDHIKPRVPHTEIDFIRQQLEHLQKERQILFATGNAVNQECRGIVAEIQRAMSTLQRNAADNARRKRDSKRQKR